MVLGNPTHTTEMVVSVGQSKALVEREHSHAVTASSL